MLVAEQSPSAVSPSTDGKHHAARTMRPGRVIASPIDENTMLIIGLGRPISGDVTVEIDGGHAGPQCAVATNWRLAAALPMATHGFAALLPAPSGHEALTTIGIDMGPAIARYIVSPRSVSVEAAAALIADSAGSQAGTAIAPLVEVLLAHGASRRRIFAASALLQATKGNDGFIELIGESHDGAVFLQGWSRSVAPGHSRMAMAGPMTSLIMECAIAVFPRQDVPDGATGFVGLLDASEAIRAPELEGLIFQGSAGWSYVTLQPRIRIAGPLETPEHIRSILLRTQSAPDVLLSLRSAANSFDGKETVSSLPYPVRMGIDDAYESDGGNVLISGWLLDPDGHVETVNLRRRGTAVRLDEHWTRLERPDVSDSFSDQSQFIAALRGRQQASGFVVHAKLSGGDPGTQLYLELILRDSRRAFLPVKQTLVGAQAAALRQIGSIDPACCALPAIVDAQIVPFLSTSERTVPFIDAIVDAGSFDQETSPPIVIGASESEEPIFPLLALLALDLETRRAPIVIAMPAEYFRTQAARLGELIRFYRLSVRLVSVNGAGDAFDLLEAGTQALSCETVILLSASLLPHGTGWYGKLVATAATLEGSIVSPVLAYEDHSVRWAGSWLNEDSDDQPVLGHYAGYPLKSVAAMKLTPVAAASLECCVMPRNALLNAGGFASGYLGSLEKGLDLSLRLGRSGIRSFLLPSVQMWSCDASPRSEAPAATAMVEEIDRKILNGRWSPALARDRNSERRSA